MNKLSACHHHHPLYEWWWLIWDKYGAFPEAKISQQKRSWYKQNHPITSTVNLISIGIDKIMKISFATVLRKNPGKQFWSHILLEEHQTSTIRHTRWSSQNKRWDFHESGPFRRQLFTIQPSQISYLETWSWIDQTSTNPLVLDERK